MYKYKCSVSNNVDRENDYRDIMPSVFLIERLPRNISQHAAGVVLSKEKLNRVIPLCLGPSGALMSQYSKDYIEEVELLKMDFLGLRGI